MDKKIHDSFEALRPTEEQSARMLSKIEQKAAKKSVNHRKMPKIMRFAATFALIALMIFSIGTVTNMATNGKVMEVIRSVLSIEQKSQSVSGQAQQIAERSIEVWAPDIFGMNDEYIIFGTKRGVVVYDRTNDAVSATVDTQEIGCIYFDSDSKNSHVLLDGDSIIIYNSEGGKPYGDCYIYNVKEIGRLEPKIGKAEACHEKWLAHQQNYHDTFTMYHESEWFRELSDKMGDMYSRRALMYDGSYNFFVITKDCYVLYTENGGDVEKNILSMETLFETDEQNESLPMFVYSGSDKAIAAICDWFYEDALRYAERGQVWVPGFIIRHEDDKNGEHLVFGNFWSYGYMKNGNMMEEASGGEMPACFHLKERADGSYEVVSVERARDGSYYSKDIKRFCKGYFGLASKIMKNDTEERRNAAREYMAMYVRDNGLDIEYIKEYGWDPFSVFE